MSDAKKGRPEHLRPEAHELYETWLIPNGIDGWLPLEATIDVHDGQITYDGYRTTGGGHCTWDGDEIAVGSDGYAAVEQVTVPLVVPLTDRVRELIAHNGLTLVE